VGIFRPRVTVALAAAVAAALLLAGCSSGSPPTAAATSTPEGPGSAVPGGTTLMVAEWEYSVSFAAVTIGPGTYTVEVANQGKMSHNLNIKGPGVDNWRSPTLSPGTTTRLAVTLQRGTYELWCSIDHHKALGMDNRIHVN
jgi:uncharacterized cupredoxin-like copper-binding protein